MAPSYFTQAVILWRRVFWDNMFMYRQNKKLLLCVWRKRKVELSGQQPCGTSQNLISLILLTGRRSTVCDRKLISSFYLAPENLVLPPWYFQQFHHCF